MILLSFFWLTSKNCIIVIKREILQLANRLLARIAGGLTHG